LRCCVCKSRRVVDQKGLISMLVEGLQVKVPVCEVHSKSHGWFPKAERRLRILEKAYRRGREFTEETCLMCSGSGDSESGKCPWCDGKGRVRPVPLKTLVSQSS